MRKFILTNLLAQRLAVLASAVLFGAVCTHWALQARQALQPADLPGVLVPQAASPLPDPVSLHLFGVNADLSAQTPVAPPPNLRLIGVIAGGRGSDAVAVLAIDGKPTPVRRGDALGGGSVLRDIRRDRVVVDTAGQSAEIVLGDTGGGAGAPVAGALPPGALPPPPLPGPGAALPSGLRATATPATVVPPFKLEVKSVGPNQFSFSKGELSRALADPKLAASMGKATPSGAGGLQLDEVPAGSLSDRLGLRAGDILRSANGQTLISLGDLPRLYQEFGTASSVRLEIVRGGQPTLLQYTVRP